MGRSFSPFRVTNPKRFFHVLPYRLLFVLWLVLLFKQHHLFFQYRQALAAKYTTTIFPDDQGHQAWTPDERSTPFQDLLIANRADWKTLGAGYEGKTFIYQGYVIKTFTPGRSPFRNCAPGATDERWPTEIPASLYFGGVERNTTSMGNGFLPVRSAFKADCSSTQAEWHLVTPLVNGGSLKSLASRIRKLHKSYREVDELYRPAFERLLYSLQGLHEAGYCHDDVKPDNIFVADNTNWLWGDLGNLRQLSHPYHESLLWAENKQLSDCRANDALRALKSYLQFVRDSAADVNAFNAEFFKSNAPLTTLFWWALASTSQLSAAELRAKSAGCSPVQRDDACGGDVSEYLPKHTQLGQILRRLGHPYDINRALETRMGERKARRWALTWVFGLPVSEVCDG